MILKHKASHWEDDKLISVWYWEFNGIPMDKIYNSEEEAWTCRHPEVIKLKHGY